MCRDARGEWAMVTVCAQPDDFERTEIAQVARADTRRFAVAAGGGGDAGAVLRAEPGSLEVRLRDARVSARFEARRDWPKRPFHALGPAQVVPGLGQYWTPHLLGAQVEGEADLGGRTYDLSEAHVYAEKNWGTAFARHWWWGQASLEHAGVAFAGGRVHGVAPTSVVAWIPGKLVALAPPLARTTALAHGGEWRIEARSTRHTILIQGEAVRPPLRLPVPIPKERRLAIRSEHHLAATLHVTLRQGRRILLDGISHIAGLEDGSEVMPSRSFPPPASAPTVEP